MKYKHNMAGFRELRNSREVQSFLEDRAEAVADAAMSGYNPSAWEENEGFIPTDASEGARRARAAVVTGNPHAANHAAKHNTLVRALEAGRFG